MNFRRRYSSDSSSSSEEQDTVRGLFREFRNRPGRVNFFEQRNIRRDRDLERRLRWSIYEESSLNLVTLFGDAEGDELTTPPFFGTSRRYCIRSERQSRRHARLTSFNGFGDYGIGNLFVEQPPAPPSPPRPLAPPPEDDFNQWVANLEAAVEGAVGGVDEQQDEFAAAIAIAATGGEVDWSRFAERPLYIDETRTRLGFCLVGARTDIKRALVIAVVRIRETSPGLNARAAWRQLVARLRRERVVETELEASRMWTFAFNEPAGAHFRSIFEADFAVLYNLWERL